MHSKDWNSSKALLISPMRMRQTPRLFLSPTWDSSSRRPCRYKMIALSKSPFNLEEYPWTQYQRGSFSSGFDEGGRISIGFKHLFSINLMISAEFCSIDSDIN